MKNRIKKKLRSQTGASITFALLLFLVCTVLCSVIITAATTSSGRMSRIAETDQRYYAVTSAAELLKDTINGKTVSIVTVTETPYTTTYTSGVAGEPVKGTPVVIKIYIVADKKANEITKDVDLVDSNLLSNISNDSLLKDAAKRIAESSTTPLSDQQLSLTSDFYTTIGLDYDALAVTITEKIDENDNISFDIYNTYKAKDTASSAGDQYKLTLEFGVDKSDTTDTKTKNVSSIAKSSTEYVVNTITTETTITSLTWNLSGIKTGLSDISITP